MPKRNEHQQPLWISVSLSNLIFTSCHVAFASILHIHISKCVGTDFYVFQQRKILNFFFSKRLPFWVPFSFFLSFCCAFYLYVSGDLVDISRAECQNEPIFFCCSFFFVQKYYEWLYLKCTHEKKRSAPSFSLCCEKFIAFHSFMLFLMFVRSIQSIFINFNPTFFSAFVRSRERKKKRSQKTFAPFVWLQSKKSV